MAPVFPTKRQRRNLAKYTDSELFDRERSVMEYWTMLEGEILLRSQGDRYKGRSG